MNASVERALEVVSIRTRRPILKVLASVVALAAAITVGWVAWAVRTSGRELDAHIRIITAVDKQLGFHYGTPYENGEEVFVITDVTPGGIMDRSGMRVGDYPECTIASLYERIVFGQGRKVHLALKRSGTVVNIEIMVPALALADDPSQLHWYYKRHVD